MDKIIGLNFAVLKYMEHDPKRIQHFTKVHAFAKLIGQREKIPEQDLFILESAALLHDIGIKNAEAKYGTCTGKQQELEGPPEAEKILQTLEYKLEEIERIKYLIAHHHTYTNIQDLDYQILVEADFLVNLYEDNCSKDAVVATKDKIFKTKCGKEILNLMFGV